MKKLPMQTPDLTQSNIEKIEKLFPNAITEKRDDKGNIIKGINFDILRQELSDELVESGEECYDFTWVGKKQSILEANMPIRRTLRPCIEESKDFENTENLYIEGDNLEVLKMLQESYLNSVKMIYIDPPYNTGNDFVYKDDYRISREEYLEQTAAYDEDENRLFQNNEANGRFHSDWCSMMYPRLKLARSLLTENGVIFISIDDNEVDNLKKICSEIFGESNFIGDIIWEKRFTRNNDAKLISSVIDHLILYRKSEMVNILREPRTEKANSIYKNPDNDPRGRWTSVSYISQRTKEQRPNLSYDIKNPITGSIVRHDVNSWKYSKEQHKLHVKENRLYWGRNGGNTYPRLKRFLSELKDGIVPINLWKYKEVGTLDDGTKIVNSLIGKDIFDYPKPPSLIIKMMQVAGISGSDIILDFFSGSASTAHAVMQLNSEDDGKRKFIMVQLPEETKEKSEAYKTGYKNICEIGKERIRRSGEKIKQEVMAQSSQIKMGEEPMKVPDIGFRVLKTASTNMKDVYYSADEYSQDLLNSLESNIKEDRTDLDLLYQVLLDWGMPLNLKHDIETFEGTTLHTVDEDVLIACFDEKIDEKVIREMARRKPLRVVFRDSSFKDSPSKINVEEIFKMQAPGTDVRVI